ncbi:MAG: tRNA1(Val) (adenine(37)-N6)-methyltransferase [Thermincola sp.]|jgi:tRNA1Val (adenine37-N6)-methyltransferase|nr:tRNA1(Val) (adenine(37)-N6)-methyltransferase [Thermincola sp.]MDT3702070.1 tRNA1(Val) (adenine(37)-N6)-methyltransferase [Thermincola sp.]
MNGDNDREFMLHDNERLDDLVRGGLRIIQSSKSFCFSMDAVLLANFTSVKKGDRVVDLGTGTAVIPLLISTRNLASKIVGLEIQEESVERAKRTVRGNGLEELIEIIQLDIREAESVLGVGGIDLVVSNPPYLPVGRGMQNREDPIAIARHEVCCNLATVVHAASRLVKYGGRVAMVHRPDRLTDIILEMNNCRLFPRRLQMVYPRPDKRPNMVLIEAQYGSKPELVILEPFVVYNENGMYTQQFWNTYYPGMPYPR